MSFDEPTQRLQRPSAPRSPMPGSLDVTGEGPAGPYRDADETDVLPLDELLGPPEAADADDAPDAPAPSEPAPAERPAPAASRPDEVDAEAPLATDRPARPPMPVVPVRTDHEPEPADVGVARPAGPADASAARRPRPRAGAVVQTGAAQVSGWLRRDDNALTVVTALVAILLLSVVAAFGS